LVQNSKKGGGSRDEGLLFLPLQGQQIAALRSIISHLDATAIYETMTSPKGDHSSGSPSTNSTPGTIRRLKDALARNPPNRRPLILGFSHPAKSPAATATPEARR